MTKEKNRISSIGTVRTFFRVGSCSETLCNVLDRTFDNPLETEERATMPFAGGILQHGYQCGMVWGATLAAGAQAYKCFGAGPQAEAKALFAAQKVVESFRNRYNTINCFDITKIDKSSTTMQMIIYFLIKGGSIGCFRMSAEYARIAFKAITGALSDEHIEAPSHPVSCAAVLAQKMGMSAMHQVMAAGLAGGIGLSGGACGALGAAIWIMGMKILKQGSGTIDFKNPKALEAIEQFLKHTDYEFECTEIVGRKFKTINDHAGYLHDGGCLKLIDQISSIASSV